jgi:hypothetical protein
VATKKAMDVIGGLIAGHSYNLYISFEDMSGNSIEKVYYERVRTSDRFPISQFEITFIQEEVTTE